MRDSGAGPEIGGSDARPLGAKAHGLYSALTARLKLYPFKTPNALARFGSCLWETGWWKVAGTVCVLGWVAAALAAQDTTLHLNVKLVSVFVNVTDRNGAIVGGLTKDDFAVLEDGRPQKIAVFEKVSEMPLNLTLAIDTSGSVRKDLGAEADAAHKFAQNILRPQDRMSVMQFATYVDVLTPFTDKVEVVDRGLKRLHADFATALYDAIVQGSDALGKQDGRRALIVVSDGDDTVEDKTYGDALKHALSNEVMIYSLIDVPIESSAGRDTGGEHTLITLSQQTGGKYFYVDQSGLDAAFKQVSEDLRTQYLIGYYPQKQAPGVDFHHISVTIPRAAEGDFHLRYRMGYYAEDGEGGGD
jgi:Ca-activated chloride channel homolog